MTLLFIRHTSVDVAPGTCYGQTDVPLKTSFEEEARKVKTRLADFHIDAVYCSPLTRCVRLAHFCGYEHPIIDPRLMEMNFGDWEMKKYEEIDDPRLQLWYDDFLNFVPTNGESSMQQRDRLKSFLEDLWKRYGDDEGRGHDAGENEDEAIAIFTHGGIIIHAMTLLEGITYTEAFARQPQYGDIVPLRMNSLTALPRPYKS